MTRTPAPKAPALHLLGNGLDAIIQHTAPSQHWFIRLIRRRAPRPSLIRETPSVTERRLRYYTAAAMSNENIDTTILRASLGAQYKHAWARGIFIDFRAIRNRFIARRQLDAVR